MYAPLHVHTTYSLLDGISKPTHLAKRCRELGITSCAMTDHGNICGARSFIRAMDKGGVKPIIGCELYVCMDDATVKTEANRSLAHMVVLAKNFEGWKSLMKLVSASNHPDHFYYKPRLDLNRIADYTKDGNLIAISGHMGSHISHCIIRDMSAAHTCRTIECVKEYTHGDWVARGTEMVKYLQTVFGPTNFFLEVQLMDAKNIPAMALLAQGVRYLGKKLGVPCIATPDAHYVYREDAVDQRVLLCSALHTTFKDVATKMVQGEDVALGGFFASNNYHLPSMDEMKGYGHTEEELANTLKIAEQCESYKLDREPQLPAFACPDGLTSNEYLMQLLREGWGRRLPKIQRVMQAKGLTEKDYGDRIREESAVITEYGLTDYFLIVWDIVRYAREQGSITGPSRGSAGGSLALYLLGVTEIDPLQYDLLFSRFMNKGRFSKDHISLPDVDLDFEPDFRDNIIQYIKEKYGYDNVAQLATFSRCQGRGAIKEVLRAHSACDFETMNKITKHIDDESAISDKLQEMREASEDGEASIIQYALENHAKDLAEWVYIDDDGRLQGPMSKLFEQAIRIEGTYKSMSKHAAAVIISTEPLADVVPMVLDANTKTAMVGFSMEDAEAVGLVKLDCLGVEALSKVHGVLNLLKKGTLK